MSEAVRVERKKNKRLKKRLKKVEKEREAERKSMKEKLNDANMKIERISKEKRKLE